MEFNNQCTWSITVTYNDKSKSISYPLTCEFNIERNNLATAKFATFNVYNLSPSSRMSDFFRHDFISDVGKQKIIEFSAGYNGNMSTCFRGTIIEAYSTRKGTETITTIQAVDNGVSSVNKKLMSVTFKAGTTFIEAFNHVAESMQYVKPATTGVLEGTFKMDTTLYGTPLQILNQITNNHTFVDNAELRTLNNNECLDIEPLVLSSQTGLIDVPQTRNTWTTAKTIFNPSVIVGQRAEIKTTSLNFDNDIYKIYGINHQGTISAAISGQRVTILNMRKVSDAPNSESNITAQTEFQGEKVVNGTEVYTPGKPAIENAYKFIRDNNGAIPKWKINPLVSWADMIGHSNSPEQRYAQLTPEILSNCIVIANKLHLYINSTSLKGKKFVITSGWRSVENNRAAGGKKESKHLYGSAIDLKFLDINTQKAYNEVFNKTWSGFTYPYVINGQYYIHVQTGLGVGGASRQGVVYK